MTNAGTLIPSTPLADANGEVRLGGTDCARVEDGGVIPYSDGMDGVREISVGVPDALAGEIDAAVASGDYASPSEVVGEALEQWRRGRDAEVTRLRALVREGLESGEPVEGGFDPADIARRGRERLAVARAK